MNPLELIKRSLPSDVTAGEGKLLRGLIPYNSPTRITERGRTFTEVIRPGAFARAASSGRGPLGDVLATFNHNPDRLLGRTGSGTLRLTDGPDGLRYEVELPDSAADVRELLRRGDLRGSSFTAFPSAKDGQRWKGDYREILALEVVEVGPVVAAAYDASTAEIRSAVAGRAANDAYLAALVGLMERS
jgi:uncharacterized protein